MSLPVPTVSVDPGPDWANNINASLSILDGHNHGAGSGVQITPAGININSDLSFSNNNATVLRSTRFDPQTTALSLATDIGCLYEVGVDLYYNDGVGNQIRITQSGSVSGASGTITGLPSGTASASYSAGTFTFQGATSTPATMAVGPLVVGNPVASSKTVTISPNNSIASNYNFVLPAALPAALNYMTLDNSGNVAFNTSGVTGSGAVVLSTSPTIATPTLSSAILSSPTLSNPTMTGTTTVGTGGITFTSGNLIDFIEGSWSPVFTLVSGSGTGAVASGTIARYQRVGTYVTCWLALTLVVSSGTPVITMSLPIAPSNNWGSAGQVFSYLGIVANSATSASVTTTISAKTVTITTISSATAVVCTLNYYLNN